MPERLPFADDPRYASSGGPRRQRRRCGHDRRRRGHAARRPRPRRPRRAPRRRPRRHVRVRRGRLVRRPRPGDGRVRRLRRCPGATASAAVRATVRSPCGRAGTRSTTRSPRASSPTSSTASSGSTSTCSRSTTDGSARSGTGRPTTRFPSGLAALADVHRATRPPAGPVARPVHRPRRLRPVPARPRPLRHRRTTGSRSSPGATGADRATPSTSPTPTQPSSWPTRCVPVVEAGFTFLKLDFLFAAALPGHRRDDDLSGEAAYRHGVETVRRIVGDDVYLLACGAPVIASLGVFDGIRSRARRRPVVGARRRDEVPARRDRRPARAVRRGHVRPPHVAVGRHRHRSRRGLLPVSSLPAHPRAAALLQDLARIAGFRATSDPPSWLDEAERAELRSFLAEVPTVEHRGGHRYRRSTAETSTSAPSPISHRATSTGCRRDDPADAAAPRPSPSRRPDLPHLRPPGRLGPLRRRRHAVRPLRAPPPPRPSHRLVGARVARPQRPSQRDHERRPASDLPALSRRRRAAGTVRGGRLRQPLPGHRRRRARRGRRRRSPGTGAAGGRSSSPTPTSTSCAPASCRRGSWRR